MKHLLLTLSFFLVVAVSNSQPRRIVRDYATLLSTMVSIKSEAETYALEVKDDWKNDSLKVLGKTLYAQLAAAADGLNASFGVAILSPSRINSLRPLINVQLDSLQVKMTRFKSLYVSGSMIIAKGSKFNPGVITVIVPLLEAVTSLYNSIRAIVVGQRQQTSDSFKIQTKFVKWNDLK